MPNNQHGLIALKTDITALEVDVIVNAANEQLAEGGGVCGPFFMLLSYSLSDGWWSLPPRITVGPWRVQPVRESPHNAF